MLWWIYAIMKNDFSENCQSLPKGVILATFFTLLTFWLIDKKKLLILLDFNSLKETTELGNNENDPVSVEKIQFIFIEMFKQQGKILIETKFRFCIHQPNNIEVIDRNYMKYEN